VSLFKIPKSVILKLDLIRKRFVWAEIDTDGKRKYHLTRWDAVYKKNLKVGDFNLSHMNVALIEK
jgi:hypothetical protein